MGNTAEVLDDVRAQLAPSDEALDEARRRRDIVKDAAASFDGVRDSFNSGSLAHRTMNCPIHKRDKGMDADCGVILDRRRYPLLGLDGAGLGPDNVVEAMLTHITGKVLAEYPSAKLRTTKRAILVVPNQPLTTGEDPTVDLIVALDRRNEPGLWIPNLQRHGWDPSHPQKHTELLNAEPAQLRRIRRQAIRLAKAENKRGPDPLLCSFNVEILGWMFVQSGQGVPQALLRLWQQGALDLRRQFTPDPADVSPPVKIRDAYRPADRVEAAERVDFAAARLQTALDYDYDLARVRAELRQLWPDFIAAASGQLSKARLATSIGTGSTLHAAATGGIAAAGGVPLNNPRSYGDGQA